MTVGCSARFMTAPFIVYANIFPKKSRQLRATRSVGTGVPTRSVGTRPRKTRPLSPCLPLSLSPCLLVDRDSIEQRSPLVPQQFDRLALGPLPGGERFF